MSSGICGEKMRLTNINKTYDGENYVIKDFSYNFEKRKVYVIKGVSGCGKTTLLNIIGDLDKSYEGNIQDALPTVGFVTQNNMLFQKWTVYDNLTFTRNDKDLILSIAKLLSVENILHKYPSEISGGERQRVCIIRALLNSPDIVLADEPAASLDSKNAALVADSFNRICAAGCTVIIATHKNCFDSIADEILFLDYGKVAQVQKNKIERENKNVFFSLKNTQNTIFYDIKCLLKKNRDKLKPKSFILNAVFIFFILFLFSIRLNFEYEYANIIARNYPSDTLFVEAERVDEFVSRFDAFVYENYICNEDDFNVYALFSEKDSGFSYGNMIRAGSFPQKNNQVLVDESFVREVLFLEKNKQALGKEIFVKGQSFLISGVVPVIKVNASNELIYCNLYYQTDDELTNEHIITPRVYMPYDVISKSGTRIDKSFKMISIDGMYESRGGHHLEVRKMIPDIPFSLCDNKIKNISSSVDTILIMIFCAICVLSLIALVFQKNEVGLDYYYRRREIGALRLLGVKGSRIILFLLTERLINCLLSLICSSCVFLLLCVIIYLFGKVYFFVGLSYVLLVWFALITYNFVLVVLAGKKMLKCDILTLM